MANKRIQIVVLVLCLTAFFLGGWFLGRIGSNHEVNDLYVENGESVGIFNNIPPEDMAAAEKVAADSLKEDIHTDEENKIIRLDGRQLPSQIAITDMSEIAGVAPKEDKPDTDEPKEKSAPLDLQLTGLEVASVVPQKIVEGETAQDSQITLIAAPVKYFLIQNTAEYKAFKNKARGSYPDVDFTKQKLIVLESDSNLPDNVFELVGAEEKDGEMLVSYRVNVFRLDKKINSHTVLPIDTTQSAIQLKQVL